MEVSALQPSNTPVPSVISSVPAAKSTEVSFSQPLNALLSILVVPFGMVTDSTAEFLNALDPMTRSPEELMVTLLSDLQSQEAGVTDGRYRCRDVDGFQCLAAFKDAGTDEFQFALELYARQALAVIELLAAAAYRGGIAGSAAELGKACRQNNRFQSAVGEAARPICITCDFSPKLTLLRLVQSLKHSIPIFVTVSGILMDSNAVHP